MDDAGKLSFFTLLDAGFSPDVEVAARKAQNPTAPERTCHDVGLRTRCGPTSYTTSGR